MEAFMNICEAFRTTDPKAWQARRAMIYLFRKNPARFRLVHTLHSLMIYDKNELVTVIEKAVI
jgi:hypothetical protein